MTIKAAAVGDQVYTVADGRGDEADQLVSTTVEKIGDGLIRIVRASGFFLLCWDLPCRALSLTPVDAWATRRADLDERISAGDRIREQLDTKRRHADRRVSAEAHRHAIAKGE